MKILIPTDFSKLSRIAVCYAAKMVQDLDAELVLIHVVDLAAPPQTMAAADLVKDIMYKNAKEDIQALEAEVRNTVEGDYRLSHVVLKGNPVDKTIDRYAHDHQIDFIVMGTKGASGLKKVLMGSKAAAMINTTNLPVLTVPEHARFDGIRTIVYATDMQEPESDLAVLVPFARVFNARLHILHVAAPGENAQESGRILEALKAASGYDELAVHVSTNQDVTEGIDDYIADTKADMLAMFTHPLRFMEKITGKSVTREMAFHSWIPILAFTK
ncbi:MAG: hypothetical protein EP344_17870 [Bacteroidetes bacterium]|nr:MAG: hypothetical protein EP344_17870 [Bacteroidota bacterium]